MWGSWQGWFLLRALSLDPSAVSSLGLCSVGACLCSALLLLVPVLLDQGPVLLSSVTSSVTLGPKSHTRGTVQEGLPSLCASLSMLT